MKKISLLIFLIVFVSFISSGIIYAQGKNSDISIIPKPLHLKLLSGKFILSPHTRILVDPNSKDLETIGEQLSDHIGKLTGFKIPVVSSKSYPAKDVIIFSLRQAADTLGEEGYMLSVNADQIMVKALRPQGIFYGVQSIYQLLPLTTTNDKISIPAIEITDKPRFEWRGLMLDVGRYFYSVDFVKKYIDYLAIHKLNTFHWHLTEDHGWRIEIKKYPKLTQIGAWREGTQYDRHPDQVNHTPHGGYYTQEQVKEIVAYAKDRYVNVVPEIEMPGHTLAALVAYPELSCTGGPFKMPLHWAIQKDIYCAGNEQTFKFLEDILSEVAELFPSPIIHIGGDEAPKDRWKACSKCQARIKTEGLKDEHELQSYFIKRIENFLLTRNKRIIGWDEILEGGLAPNAAVMSWRGIEGGIAAAKQHHDVVMSPTDFMYFDYYQGEPYLEPPAIGGMLTLEKVYSYEPIPPALSPAEAVYIKGVQGNVWGEYIHSPGKAEYMAFPRAAALAETAWTSTGLRNWDDFKRRMESQYKRYHALGINYSESAYHVSFTTAIDSLAERALVTLTTQSHHADIRYTLDGSEPSPHSLKYEKPLSIHPPITIKAATFKDGEMKGKVSECGIIAIQPSNKRKDE